MRQYQLPNRRISVCKRRTRLILLYFTMLVLLTLTLLSSHAATILASRDLVAYPSDVQVEIGEATNVTFRATVELASDVLISFNKSAYIDVIDDIVIPRQTGVARLIIRGKQLTSRAFIEVADCSTENSTTCPLDLSDAFVRVTVFKSHIIDVLVNVVGWAYFFAWSISFYPQIFLNCQRKSVIGLNFDFLLLNVVGFTAYSIYNLLIYYNKVVQDEYEFQHPRSPIPVLLNDVVFAVHALFACLITAAQCFFYERENQRVSRPCMALATVLIFCGFLAGSMTTFRIINILQFVNSLSYIKMAVTLSKYFPQAYFNFLRKSTVGWSIGNVLLDFTGGSLDILQMVLQAVNVSDWSAFYGNPVKFGLGLVSIIFDVVFMVQHYVLYRDVEVVHNNIYEGIENPDARQSPSYGSQGSPENAIIVVDD